MLTANYTLDGNYRIDRISERVEKLLMCGNDQENIPIKMRHRALGGHCRDSARNMGNI
jgi:hypothetical protein